MFNSQATFKKDLEELFADKSKPEVQPTKLPNKEFIAAQRKKLHGDALEFLERCASKIAENEKIKVGSDEHNMLLDAMTCLKRLQETDE